jgi:hypothetical protein
MRFGVPHLIRKYQGPQFSKIITLRALAIGKLGAENRHPMRAITVNQELTRTCENLLAARCRLLMSPLISIGPD